MKRAATDRLLVSVVFSISAAVIAVLVGLPEVALFAAPWLVLCALGITYDGDPNVQIHVDLDQDRLVVGDAVEAHVKVSAGVEALVTVTPAPSTAFVTTRDARQPVVDLVSAQRPAEITFVMPTHGWGTHDVGTMVVQASHAYGLFRSRAVLHQRSVVRAHPTPRQLQELLAPARVRRVAGTHRSREAAHGIEYADIRQFAAGDSVRDINWRASARSPDLWVSQRHPDRATDVILLVDSFVETGHDVRRIFGLIADASIAIAESHLSVSDRVGLIEFGGVVRWVTPATGRVQLQRLTDALLATGLYENAADKELPILPSRALPPRSFVIALTPLLDDRFVEAVFTARGRGHDVAVIECPPVHAERGDASYAQVVARRFWDTERSMLRDRMAEQGIAVAGWDGQESLDLVLSQLMQRRRGGRVRSGA